MISVQYRSFHLASQTCCYVQCDCFCLTVGAVDMLLYFLLREYIVVVAQVYVVGIVEIIVRIDIASFFLFHNAHWTC